MIDRETYADGSFGPPSMIFPESARDDNSAGPGILIDIPDQRQDLPYFKMTSKNPNYAGELLSVIISPTPLKGLENGGDGNVLNPETLTEIELDANAEVFHREDAGDRIYSKAESESACGGHSRQATAGKTADRPCGATSRQLTRDEPLPQSLFKVKGVEGRPAVAFVRMAVH